MEQVALIIKRKAEAEREFTPIELAFIAQALILRECTADEIFGSELWDAWLSWPSSPKRSWRDRLSRDVR